MTPVLPQMDPVPLAAPPLVFWLLLMLTFTLHVVMMNAVLGGSIIGAAARWLGAEGSAEHARLARLIGRAMPVAIAAAVTFGVAALLFLQVLYGRVFFSSSVLMARIWFAIVPLLIVAYYAAYALGVGKAPDPPSRQPRRRASVPVVLAIGMAAIFAVIAFIYSNNMGLMLQVEALPGLFARDARGLHINSADPAMVPRYLHMLLGALATAGVMVCLAGVLIRRRDQPFGAWAIRWGRAWFAVATVLNLPVGVWWFGVLPQPVITQLLGGNAAATSVLVAGIAVLLASLGLLFAASRAGGPAFWVFSAAGTLLVGIVLMLLTRDFIRQEALDAAGFTVPTAVAPQWGVIAIFVLLLVAAIGTVAWMVRQLAVAHASAETSQAAVATQA
jgi:hypothetical protein